MHKFLLPGLFLLIYIPNLQAQHVTAISIDPNNSHEYYIRISGINSRQIVEDLQNSISKKAGINFFMANRYPVRYFLMRSDRPIDQNEFKHWLNRSCDIEFYGEGKKGREQATVLYNKTKAQ